jgi:low affinity Fe/Cu permease
VSAAAGAPITFCLAVGVVLVWAITGRWFGFSDTWQLVINTGTTIVTFLMVFLIQNTQNRDATAMQIKLDELIRAIEGAQNRIIAVEDMPEEGLVRLRERFMALADEERTREG